MRRYLSSSTTRELVAAYLCRCGIETAFDDYTGFAPGEPKDRQVELLISRHNLAPNHVLFVGDSPRDAELLRRAGIRFIGVEHLFGGDAFRQRGLPSVPDLAALTRLWREDARRLEQVEPVGRRTARPPR